MKPEPVDCADVCENDDTRIQPLSAESSLIEIVHHSNPVVLVEKLDAERYPDVSDVYFCVGIYFITVLNAIRLRYCFQRYV